MDSDKGSARVERLEVVETGRRRRWSEGEKLKIVLESLQAAPPGCGHGAALWHFALVAAPMATVVSARAERCGRTTSGLRASEGSPSAAEGGPGPIGAGRDDRDRVFRRPDADHRRGRCGDAEGRVSSAG